MEFPNLGKQCALETCKQLDFLPFTCSNCGLIFCDKHYVTSAHDCKHLNEFFKKESRGVTTEFFMCSQENCVDRSPIKLVCSYCNLHFCVSHRHHGCKDELNNSEVKKLRVKEWKKPKEQFKIAKAESDKNVEMTLRKAETTHLQPLAQKLRLMRIKGKALGDNKIPSDNRIYFQIHYQTCGETITYESSPLFTSNQWSVGKTIDLFSKRLKLDNKNNEMNAPKLRLFRLSDGLIITDKTDTLIGSLLDDVIQNGDSLILAHIKNEDLNGHMVLPSDIQKEYELAVVK